MSNNKKNEIIYQGNVLTESRYDFNRTEKNAIYCIIKEVRKTYIEEDSTGYAAYQNLLVTMPGNVLDVISDAKDRQRTQKSLINLRHRDITIEDKKGNWLNTGFINWAKYKADADIYEVEVSSEIMPYLVQLASKYTAYNLTVAISLKSKWSQRFYELCCQYKNYKGGEFHKKIGQLRTMFMLEEQYPLLTDFKKNVINVAQKELKALYDGKHCDVCFDYEQTGKGGEAMFHFFITSREREQQQKQERQYTSEMVTHISVALNSHFKGRNTKAYLNRVMQALVGNKDLVTDVYEKICRIEMEYPKSEQAAVLRYALREDFNIK